MPDRPTGTVTFLFTDIDGSTQLIQRLGDGGYGALLDLHRRLVRGVVSEQGGVEIDRSGDALFVAFPSATAAARAAVEIQRVVAGCPWPGGEPPRVRIGLHTGEPIVTPAGYVGLDVHRAARVCAVGHGGQILLSETTRALVLDSLPSDASLRDLGTHWLKDLQHPERLFQLIPRDLPSEFPPLRSLGTPNNLPIQLTSFIGREREMEEIRTVLARARLVTLVGPGGSGKTRLAIQVAAGLIDHFPDGVWLVELAATRDPAHVGLAIAGALGIRESSGRHVLDLLVDQLRPRHLLLLLDHCEHLISACAELAYVLLRAGLGLRVLATSRQALGAAGEVTYPVPTLALPDLDHLPPPPGLMQTEAVRLFVDRAMLASPRFALTVQNASTVARLVTRLDGIPLAIELAAARTAVLPVSEIDARLDDRFRLLIGRGTGQPKQQTLRDTMDWSFELLTPSERILFRRLSVFAGGFSLEAAEAVAGDEGIDRAGVLDLLAHLVEKSLVIADSPNGRHRFRMLETIREYGWEKLAEAGESERLQAGHAEFFVQLAEQAASGLWGPRMQEWLERLDGEHDNLRTALRRTLRALNSPGYALMLAGALWQYWFERGYWTEGREWLDQALRAYRGGPERASIRARCGAAALAWRQGDHHHAQALAEAGQLLSRELKDDWGLAFSLLILALVARRRDRYQQAADLHEQALAIFRRLGDWSGIAWSLRLLGIVLWYRGDYQGATGLFEEALGIYRELGDQRGIADSLHGLGRTAAYQRDLERATRHLNECLGIYLQLGSPAAAAATAYVLGKVALHQGDHDRAAALLQENLALVRRMKDEVVTAAALTLMGRIDVARGALDSAAAWLRESLAVRAGMGYDWDRWGVAESVEAFARLAVSQGRAEAAAILYGAAARLRTDIGTPLPPIDRQEYDRDLEIVAGQLGQTGFQKAWQQGEILSAREALSSPLLLPAA